jgi:hypothetical protein
MITHWGTFNKGSSLWSCSVIAQNALSTEGYRLADTVADGPQFLLGVGGQELVTVFLDLVTLTNTRITVAAHSEDSAAAEGARNRVRSRIVMG